MAGEGRAPLHGGGGRSVGSNKGGLPLHEKFAGGHNYGSCWRFGVSQRMSLVSAIPILDRDDDVAGDEEKEGEEEGKGGHLLILLLNSNGYVLSGVICSS
ncbi:hypothetical protein Vafri_8700 [Volvox africanus]|uniref:Uncharacterized protein n=1 Tax=Volvox africanus TaxID=51714 RepID=A0A8J4F1Q1_9CHLO|nr:hypothetical protein Vafri_8700 [Volvox africanus]